MQFRIAEVVDRKKVLIPHAIKNGFGHVFQQLPPTIETDFIEKDFNPKELGDSLVEMGEMLRQQSYYIKDIELKSEVREQMDDIGKELLVTIIYELTDKEIEVSQND